MKATTVIRPDATTANSERLGGIFCPICTHTVPGMVYVKDRKYRVRPGQRCTRCNSSLDPGVVVRLLDHAA